MNKQRGFVGIAVLIVIIIGLGASGVYLQKTGKLNLSQKSGETVTTENIKVDQTATQESATAKVKFDAQITTTENCSSEDCFDKKFAQCEKATMTKEINSYFGTNVYHYEIVGQEGSGCRVTTKYLKSAEPTWENKEMTCTYNNKLSMEVASEAVMKGIAHGSVKCSGPLFTILQETL